MAYEKNTTHLNKAQEFDPNTYVSDDEFDDWFTTTDANGNPIKKLTKEEIKALRIKSEQAKQANQA